MTQNGNKDDFCSFVKTMSVFLHFPQVEKEIRKEIEGLVNRIIAQEIPSDISDDVELLTAYLSERTEEKLKILVGLSGGSIEKLRRVFLLFFPKRSWNEISSDAELRKMICTFLLYPEKYPAVPQFIQDSFRLSKNWHDLIQDRNILTAVATNSKRSQYAVAVGKALEEAIARVVSDAGYQYEKGGVDLVDNKEVDLAIPDTNSPLVLIMSSYSLTTSSSQSSRANEQARMYDDVQTHNRRRRDGRRVHLVNVIDGGGWIERVKDLEKIYKNSDACFSFSTLKQLGQFLLFLKYLPTKTPVSD